MLRRCSLGMLSVDCVHQLTFLELKLATLVLPTLLLFALFMWHTVTVRKIRQGRDELADRRGTIEGVMCHFLFFVYMDVSNSAFSMLRCEMLADNRPLLCVAK